MDTAAVQTEHTDHTPEEHHSGNKTNLIAAVIVVLVVIVAAVIVVMKVTGSQQAENTSGIGYSTEAQVLVTQEDLDAAAAAAQENANNGEVALMYQNDAVSDDGINFECLLMNSTGNIYDMYIAIYTDLELTDRIYLSQLVPPGSGFENITLEHSLDVGDHTVYVVLTQVKQDEESGEESVANQVVYTMDFHVYDEDN
jgi:RecA/RadA recombinase